ncbi:hypothetical protein CCACVL1_14121 [Corchorus capsularis]|uniref:F-box domain-containing protein n=1 Tax=Corchorus capsularis TaxID=210143 RepID=A0A1R3I859_COCAP|nr:hypothetical protein CCACVL1_14121 [Corchorus capsularis]
MDPNLEEFNTLMMNKNPEKAESILHAINVFLRPNSAIEIVRDHMNGGRYVLRKMRVEGKHVPDEVISEILSWIPAKTLHGIMRYVCKTWAKEICNSSFVENHLKRSKPGLLLQNETSKSTRFLEIRENGDFEFTNMNPRPSNDNYNNLGTIISSCDGVIMYFGPFWTTICVTNPIVMDVTHVPRHFHHRARAEPSYAIARVSHSGEFKIVCGQIIEKTNETHWYILTVGIFDSWRDIGCVISCSGALEVMKPICVGDLIYWSGNAYPSIHKDVIVTDVAKEIAFGIQLPMKFMQSNFVKIGNLFASLTFQDGYCYDIHVLKDVHSDSVKWEFYQTVVLCSPNDYNEEWQRANFIACIGQELIFDFLPLYLKPRPRKYYAYNLKTRQVRCITANETAHLHTNSLVSWRRP